MTTSSVKAPRHILIIDDEENMRHMLSTLLSKSGYTVKTAADGKQALDMGQNNNHYDFILCDIKMPGMDGLEFLQYAAGVFPEATIIMMSAYGTIETAVEAMKRGAYDYISKPFKADEVLLVLEKAAERTTLKTENRRLRQQLANIEETYTFGNIIARSKAMQAVVKLIAKVAAYDTTVLITGESGTGKELVTRSIHFNSQRARSPFVPINCGGIPENLLESELFGHVKGAFTGADKKNIGLCETAHTGTLFLDEVGELPFSLQVKLLRMLQDNEIRPVGASDTKKVDIRIIAATAKDLAEEVGQGRFREDLFYRLNVMHIRLPALRERPEDIPFLCRTFLDQFNQKFGKNIEGLSPAVMNALMQHDWPGNIRELENVIERAVILTEGKQITIDDMPPGALRSGETADTDRKKELVDPPTCSLKAAQRQWEKKLITRALLETGGNRTKAAKLLEISHPSLLRKIKEYQLDV